MIALALIGRVEPLNDCLPAFPALPKFENVAEHSLEPNPSSPPIFLVFAVSLENGSALPPSSHPKRVCGCRAARPIRSGPVHLATKGWFRRMGPLAGHPCHRGLRRNAAGSHARRRASCLGCDDLSSPCRSTQIIKKKMSSSRGQHGCYVKSDPRADKMVPFRMRCCSG
jgi:hypothetical protein